MSKLSRRTFLKTAGAAALAMAAAGALSACSVGTEKLMDLKVNYTAEDGKSGSFMSQTYVGTKVVNTMTIPLPEELSNYVAVRENVPVQKDKDGMHYVEIVLNLNIVDCTVQYVCEGSVVHTGSLTATAGVVSFTKGNLNKDELAALEAKYYTVADDAKITVSGTTVTVAVSKIMGTVMVNYYSGSSIMPGWESRIQNGKYDQMLQVWRKETVLKKADLMEHMEYISKEVGTTYNFSLTADQFDIIWSGNTGTAKVIISY